MRRFLIGLMLAFSLPAAAAGPVRPAGAPPPPASTSSSSAAASEDSDDDATPPPPAHEPAKPASAPAPAAKPASAAPSKEPTAAAPEPLTSKQLENAVEAVYHQKTADHLFTLHVRPASPKPGETVELELEVVRLLDPPDPVQGDRQPEDAELVAVLTRAGSPAPRLLHALKEPGDYGMHFDAAESGVATVAFSRRSSKPGLDVKFPLGIGVPTPARPDDVTLRATAGRSVVHGGEGPNDLSHLMREMADQTYALESALAEPKSGDAAAAAKALADLSVHVAGNVPADHANRQKEFDQLAGAFSGAATALSTRVSDREKARTALLQMELDSCTRCHAQFDWGVADDTSGWPAFTPATPAAPPGAAADSEAP